MIPSQMFSEEIAARIKGVERRVARLETLELAGGGDWSCLKTQIIGSGESVSAVTFGNIPQTFYHLALWVSAGAGLFAGPINLTFNGDSAENYRWKKDRWFAFGGAPTHSHSEEADLSDTKIRTASLAISSGGDSPNRNAMEANIPGYSSVLNRKSMAWRNFAWWADHGDELTIAQISKELGGGDWKNTAAITSITLAAAQNYHEGSIFTLMGVCPK